MFNACNVNHGPDIPGILQRRICKVCPYANNAASVCDNFSLFLANEPRAHHFSHILILPQLSIEAGMRNENGVDCYF